MNAVGSYAQDLRRTAGEPRGRLGLTLVALAVAGMVWQLVAGTPFTVTGQAFAVRTA